jgi:hypothetical protein
MPRAFSEVPERTISFDFQMFGSAVPCAVVSRLFPAFLGTITQDLHRRGRELAPAPGSSGTRWPGADCDQTRVVTRAAVLMSPIRTPELASRSRMSLNTGALRSGSEIVSSAVNLKRGR